MPAPRYRSRSLRRLQKTTPGGKTKKYYVAKRPNVAKCAKCGAELKGIPRLMRSEAKNAPKSVKKVQRPYGGFLCAACFKQKLKQELRASNQ
jgi:large subunit ribosomal protein L34e